MKRFWSRICGFVSEHDLFFRLFLILFGCIILPVSIACIAFNWQAENLVRTQTERTNSAYLTSLSTQLESALNAQRMQMLDYSVKETLTGSFRSNKFTKDATTLLTNALSSNENLEAVFVLDPGTRSPAPGVPALPQTSAALTRRSIFQSIADSPATPLKNFTVRCAKTAHFHSSAHWIIHDTAL